MILQIHDELVFEVPEDALDALATLVRHEMQNRAAAPRAAEGRREIGRQLGGMRTMEDMKTIGLVGGVASGKSLVAKMLAELGAGLLDADGTGHDVLADDPEVREALVDRWGVRFCGRWQHRSVRRRQRVFAASDTGTADRKFLEVLLHPRIRRRLNQLRDEFAAAGNPAVVLDAPLLLEAGWGPLCDFVLFVDVPLKSGSHGRKPAVGPRPNSPAAKPPNGPSTKNAAWPPLSSPTPAPKPNSAPPSAISGVKTSRPFRPPINRRPAASIGRPVNFFASTHDYQTFAFPTPASA